MRVFCSVFQGLRLSLLFDVVFCAAVSVEVYSKHRILAPRPEVPEVCVPVFVNPCGRGRRLKCCGRLDAYIRNKYQYSSYRSPRHAEVDYSVIYFPLNMKAYKPSYGANIDVARLVSRGREPHEYSGTCLRARVRPLRRGCPWCPSGCFFLGCRRRPLPIRNTLPRYQMSD